MSVDERLRTALHDELRSWTDTGAAYDGVLHQRRRQALRRRAGSAVAVTIMVAAGVLTWAQPWSEEPPPQPDPLPGENSIVIPAPQSPTEALDGHWAARGWVDFGQLAATVRAAGLGEWVDELRAELPADRLKLTLRFTGGYLISTGLESDGGSRGAVDYRLARLTGDRMVLAYDDGRPGETLYEWRVVGDTLRLRFLRATQGVRDGMPGEVYERALYTTVPFHRVG